MPLAKSLMIFQLLTVLFLSVSCNRNVQEETRPNIVIVYADDLGMGDLSCYGATLVQTPHIDSLADGGIKFMDAHSSAATCTPSRYSLLIGSYAFRNDAAILPGDAPLLIRPGTPTLPGMLKEMGYKTGIVGKWHLGLGDGYPDWNDKLKPGPLEVGFDYSFIIPATLDRVPTVYVENHRVPNLDPDDPIIVNYNKKVGDWPTGLERPDLLKFRADTQHSATITNGISRIGYMTGGKSALWDDQKMSETFLSKVDDFIDENKTDPFFLYFSFTDIHVPRDPNKKFQKQTTMGTRGDVIVQMDWTVGELMKILKKQGVEDNTLIIFTSDNGAVLDDGYDDKAVELVGEHDPNAGFKGGKYSAYEAGTRMPTIIYWKDKVVRSESNALFSQVDLYASLARLVHHPLKHDEAPDSEDVLDVLLGKSEKGRSIMLEESFTMALRDGDMKYIAPQTKSTPGWLSNKDIATGLSHQPQLFDLSKDKAETTNLAEQFPDVVKKMNDLLQEILSEPTREKYKK